MLPLILAAFIGVPIAEIAVFVEVGGRWGLWPTLAAIFATAIVGTFLIRQQGLTVLREVQAELDAGRLPALQIFDGLCLLIAGALLLTPGFLTDGIGFVLLMPPARRLAAAWVLSRISLRAVHMGGHGSHGAVYPDDGVIDGEYRDVTDPAPDPDDGPEPPSLPRR